jgi:hypothetical protein
VMESRLVHMPIWANVGFMGSWDAVLGS